MQVLLLTRRLHKTKADGAVATTGEEVGAAQREGKEGHGSNAAGRDGDDGETHSTDVSASCSLGVSSGSGSASGEGAGGGLASAKSSSWGMEGQLLADLQQSREEVELLSREMETVREEAKEQGERLIVVSEGSAGSEGKR